MKFCVIGVGRFGYHVATTLAENGMEVLAVDSSEAIIASIRDKVTHAICMRIDNEEGLSAIGIEDMDTVIVAMGENFAQSILVTALLKQRLHIPKVITRSISQIHKEILVLVGADEVILPEKEAGVRLADKLSLTFKALVRISPDFSISKVQAPEQFVGKTIQKINLLEEYGVLCIGKQIDGEIIPLFSHTTIQAGDQLILSGKNKDLAEIAKL